MGAKSSGAAAAWSATVLASAQPKRAELVVGSTAGRDPSSAKVYGHRHGRASASNAPSPSLLSSSPPLPSLSRTLNTRAEHATFSGPSGDHSSAADSIPALLRSAHRSSLRARAQPTLWPAGDDVLVRGLRVLDVCDDYRAVRPMAARAAVVESLRAVGLCLPAWRSHSARASAAAFAYQGMTDA
jgi:hypothetical protein